MASSIDQRNFVKTALRLPPELHARVHEHAQRGGRSYNAQLVKFIEDAVLTSDERMVRDQELVNEVTAKVEAAQAATSIKSQVVGERAPGTNPEVVKDIDTMVATLGLLADQLRRLQGKIAKAAALPKS